MEAASLFSVLGINDAFEFLQGKDISLLEVEKICSCLEKIEDKMVPETGEQAVVYNAYHSIKN